jgi:hypothetical protein
MQLPGLLVVYAVGLVCLRAARRQPTDAATPTTTAAASAAP